MLFGRGCAMGMAIHDQIKTIDRCRQQGAEVFRPPRRRRPASRPSGWPCGRPRRHHNCILNSRWELPIPGFHCRRPEGSRPSRFPCWFHLGWPRPLMARQGLSLHRRFPPRHRRLTECRRRRRLPTRWAGRCQRLRTHWARRCLHPQTRWARHCPRLRTRWSHRHRRLQTRWYRRRLATRWTHHRRRLWTRWLHRRRQRLWTRWLHHHRRRRPQIRQCRRYRWDLLGADCWLGMKPSSGRALSATPLARYSQSWWRIGGGRWLRR
jgi:hypothetical protein